MKRKYHPPKNKESAASTTHKKVVDVDMGSKTVETETVEGYRLFDMGIISKLVRDLYCVLIVAIATCMFPLTFQKGRVCHHMFQSSVLVVIHEVNILPPLYRV